MLGNAAKGRYERGWEVRQSAEVSGGKAALAPFLAKTIAMNDLDGCACYEPFAGGAGAAARYGLCRVGGAQELLIAPEHLQLPTPDFREDALAWTT